MNDRRTWRNWGRTEAATPSSVSRPGSTEEVVELVGEAATTGRRLRPVGSGHSFSGIATPEDVQVELSDLRGLVGVDGHLVTLRGGTRLHEIPGLLAPHGLAMTNLGDIDRQTIAGATGTGTHGTGLRFGGIATQIVGATLVDGTGLVHTVRRGDPDMNAIAIGLGALGIVVDLTIECVPAFGLRAEQRSVGIDDAVEAFSERVTSTDHHEFYWFPHTGTALTKTNVRVPADTPFSGPGRIRRVFDDEVLSNGLFGALCELGARAPGLVPGIGKLAGAALSDRTVTASSAEVFTSPRRVRFREMEYAIPLDEIPAAMSEVRRMIDARRHRVSFPVEVRAAAADDLMVSTAAGRVSGYVAVHRYHRDDTRAAAAYFADVEAIMVGHGGRPHWGKMHTRDAAYLRRVYPRFDEFLAVRDRMDPHRVFSNRYLRRVLGD
nr:D-arabinono-1,4-lactone oxidase [Williamsia sterculiae]